MQELLVLLCHKQIMFRFLFFTLGLYYECVQHLACWQQIINVL